MKLPVRLIGIVAVLLGVTALGGAVALAADTLKTVDQGEIPLTGVTWGDSNVSWSVNVSGGAPAGSEAAVRAAMDDWAHETSGGAFVLAEDADADISISLIGGGGRIAGSAQWSSSGGLLNDCTIRISGKSFGRVNTADVIKSVVLHEAGHCLGLGHATSSQDAMFDKVQKPPVTQLSDCDLKAWTEVMHWLVVDGSAAHPPHVSEVSCGDAPAPGGADPASADVATDKASYEDRESAIITVTVTDDGGDPVSGVDVTVEVTTAKGRRLSGSGTTDDDGVARFRYRVKSGRDGIGQYTVDATACNNSVCVNGSTTFDVTR